MDRFKELAEQILDGNATSSMGEAPYGFNYRGRSQLADLLRAIDEGTTRRPINFQTQADVLAKCLRGVLVTNGDLS